MTIFYTTDGTTPTAASTPYSAPFSASNNVIIKAIRIEDNYLSSPVASTVLGIDDPTVETYPDQVTNFQIDALVPGRVAGFTAA